MSITQWQWTTFTVALVLTVIFGIYDLGIANNVHNHATLSGLVHLALERCPVITATFLVWAGIAIGHLVLPQYVPRYLPCPKCTAEPAHDTNAFFEEK